MTILNRSHAAMARTTTAITRAPNEGPVFSFSMPLGYSRAGLGGEGSVVGAAQVLEAVATGRAAVELEAGEPVAADLRGVGIALGDGVAARPTNFVRGCPDEQDACGGDGGGGAHVLHRGPRWALRPPPASPNWPLTAWPGCRGAERRPPRRPARGASRRPGGGARASARR